MDRPGTMQGLTAGRAGEGSYLEGGQGSNWGWRSPALEYEPEPRLGQPHVGLKMATSASSSLDGGGQPSLPPPVLGSARSGCRRELHAQLPDKRYPERKEIADAFG